MKELAVIFLPLFPFIVNLPASREMAQRGPTPFTSAEHIHLGGENDTHLASVVTSYSFFPLRKIHAHPVFSRNPGGRFTLTANGTGRFGHLAPRVWWRLRFRRFNQ